MATSTPELLLHAPDDERRLRRIEVPLPGVDPLAWLDSWAPGQRVYWASRDGALEVAGAGVADEITGGPEALDGARERLTDCGPRARYLGRFDFGRGGAGAGRFVLPRVEVGRDAGGTWLAVNDGPGPWPLAATPGPAVVPQTLERSDTPGRDGWVAAVDAARRQMSQEALTKVVLARFTDLQLSADAQPTRILSAMAGADPRTFRFLVEHGDHAFVGASPERLYARRGRRVYSEALAGTRPRGADAETEAGFANELYGSAKDRHEHAIVVDAIREAFAAACEIVTTPSEPSVRPYAHVQHLHTPVTGNLRAGIDDAWLIQALHPTPAVCGAPRRDAARALAALERFDRGPYAAPLGWVSADAAEFCVALRCAELQGRQARLWAGAGIVPASDPAAEWDELNTKLTGALAAFGGAP